MKRRIKAYLLSFLRPRTFLELMDLQLTLFPGGKVGEDGDGQLVIYTAMQDQPTNTEPLEDM